LKTFILVEDKVTHCHTFSQQWTYYTTIKHLESTSSWNSNLPSSKCTYLLTYWPVQCHLKVYEFFSRTMHYIIANFIEIHP